MIGLARAKFLIGPQRGQLTMIPKIKNRAIELKMKLLEFGRGYLGA